MNSSTYSFNLKKILQSSIFDLLTQIIHQFHYLTSLQDSCLMPLRYWRLITTLHKPTSQKNMEKPLMWGRDGTETSASADWFTWITCIWVIAAKHQLEAVWLLKPNCSDTREHAWGAEMHTAHFNTKDSRYPMLHLWESSSSASARTKHLFQALWIGGETVFCLLLPSLSI